MACPHGLNHNSLYITLTNATLQEQRLAAVSYARTHLAPWAPQHMPELQRVLAALVFGSSTKVAPYKALFAEGRWAALLELFLRELYKLHALLPESALTVHLQVRGAQAVVVVVVCVDTVCVYVCPCMWAGVQTHVHGSMWARVRYVGEGGV